MKLALIFVIGFVALSSQQQLQKRLIWMTPYAPPRSYYRHNLPASSSFYGKSNPIMYHQGDQSFNPLGRYHHQPQTPNALFFGQHQPAIGSRYYQPFHHQQTPAGSYFAPPVQVNINFSLSIIPIQMIILIFDY